MMRIIISWEKVDLGGYGIDEIELLRYKGGKLSKSVNPVRRGGKDYNKPLGQRELMKFKKQILEKHHIDIEDVISNDVNLK